MQLLKKPRMACRVLLLVVGFQSGSTQRCPPRNPRQTLYPTKKENNMTSLSRTSGRCVLGLAAWLLFCPPAPAGWFKDVTGFRTPERIRKIAPNGIRLQRLPQTSSRFGMDPVPAGPLIHLRNNRRRGMWFSVRFVGVISAKGCSSGLADRYRSTLHAGFRDEDRATGSVCQVFARSMTATE